MSDEMPTQEADPWEEALAEQKAAEGGASEDLPTEAELGTELTDTAGSGEGGEGGEIMHDGSLDVILDIPVLMSLEVGRTDISIRQLLQLKQGSVVELDRLAGDSLDVLVNGTLVAHGEVVVVNEKYGIRLTDVLSPKERIRQLR